MNVDVLIGCALAVAGLGWLWHSNKEHRRQIRYGINQNWGAAVGFGAMYAVGICALIGACILIVRGIAHHYPWQPS